MFDPANDPTAPKERIFSGFVNKPDYSKTHVSSGEASLIPWQAVLVSVGFFCASIDALINHYPVLTFLALLLSGFSAGVSVRSLELKDHPFELFFIGIMGALCGFCTYFCIVQVGVGPLVILGLITGVATGQIIGLLVRSLADWASSRAGS
jgi:hypothetical protein